MCGITGIIDFNNTTIDQGILTRMNDALVHRGPDGDGIHLTHHAGLGHRRLAIIDVAGGTQPMISADGRYTLVFNGEIYNYRELRSLLEKAGDIFTTQSDTEVLLQLLMREGKDCLNKLNGMFAFAFWDAHEKKLLAGRDRLGKKPFYYHQHSGLLVFASEAKALLAHPNISRTLDLQAFADFFTYEYVPAPRSIFRDIKKLPAAHTLEFSQRGLEISRYWNIPLGNPIKDIDEKSAAKKLYEELHKAVAYRLISDVPLGVFLSGGIDSSVIVALMAEQRAGKDIKTFSIHFNEASYDESLYSDEIARRFGTDHHVETLTASRMLEVLPRVASFMDEPFADGSILPTYLLSGFTRKNVTVALGGDGSDELFAGYPTFYADSAAHIYQAFPGFVKKCAAAFASILPSSEKNMSLDFKLRQFLAGADYPDILRQQVWLSAAAPQQFSQLISTEIKNQLENYNPLDQITNEMASCPSKNPGERLLYFYEKFYLEGDILVKTDRASMAHSLEVRAPFLDVNVVEFVSRLPFEFKLKGITTKYLLKKTFNRKLPAMITQRPKKGFGIPIAGWLKRELSPLVNELLSENSLKKAGLFNPGFVSHLINEHQSGKRNHRKMLFALLVFELWRKEFAGVL